MIRLNRSTRRTGRVRAAPVVQVFLVSLACSSHLAPAAASQFTEPGAARSVGPVDGARARSADVPVAAPSDPPTIEALSLTGTWGGAIELPSGGLVIRVHFETRDGTWSGTIDIPAQGARGLGLRNISLEGDRARFEIAGIPGEPTFDGKLAGDRLAGRFSQAGAVLDFELERGGAAEFARPQVPQPPFPYASREVHYSNGAHDSNGRVRFAGTLTIPAGEGPHPGIVLLSGSGPQDRNGTVFGHEPFLVLADQLSRRGIAVLRSDDRGVGGSTGRLDQTTTAELALDARAAVAFLAAQPEIDPDAVGLLGHSEGGIVAPAAAVVDEGIAFVILLGAPGVPGDAFLLRQTELILAANGIEGPEAEAQVALLRQSLDLILSNAPEGERRDALRALARRQMRNLPEDQQKGLGPAASQIVDQQIEMAMTPWFVHLVRYDPRPALEALEVPVLSIHGSLDLQVDPKQSVPAIRSALARHRDATVLELEGLNHLLQSAPTGSPIEYGAIEQTIDPLVLETIYRWIADRFLGSGEPE